METNENPNRKTTENNSKTKEYVIIALLAVALIGSLVYNMTKNKQKTETIELLNIDLKDTETAKELLQEEFDKLNSEFNTLQNDWHVKDSLLGEKNLEIEKKQKEIQSLLSKKNTSESDLKKAQKLIHSLNLELSEYKEEITVLKAKNDSLQLVNDSLKFEKNTLAEEVVTQTKRAEESENTLRATFTVSNYKITGLKVRKSGKEVETDKARRIDKLRVSFDLDPNVWVESGETEIFIAIYKPDGSLGKFKGANYGKLDTWSKGTIEYSDRILFDYQKGSKKNISFDWEDYEFPKGAYRVDLYQNGMRIGQESLNLR